MPPQSQKASQAAFGAWREDGEYWENFKRYIYASREAGINPPVEL